MQALLTPIQFADRAVGIPWRRWCSSWEAVDCYGLVILYFREVLGIDLGAVPKTDIADGFAGIQGWTECDRAEPGAIGFMTWRDGTPNHCGVVMPGRALLHAQEGYPISEHGSVRVSRMAAMQRLCPDLRFYRYTSPC